MALINPTVYGELIREKVQGKVKLLQLAKPLSNLEEFREVGESISFPVWALTSPAEEIALRGTISTEELQQTESTATIQHIGKGISVFDRLNLTALGDAIEEGSSQIAQSLSRKMDAMIATEINDNVVLKSATAGASVITEDEMFDAFALFGDLQERDTFSGIVINSKLMKSFYGMESFTSTGSTLSADGNGIPTNGIFGFFTGVPIYISDKETWDSTASEAITYILKKDAVGYKMKRNILVEEDRVASQKKTDLFGDTLLAVKLLDPSGVVVARKTIV